MTQRSSADIATELTDLRAARSALIKGERVEDVWRDGKRMRVSKVSVPDITETIRELEREYAAALAAESGSGGATAFGVHY